MFDPSTPSTWSDADWAAAYGFESDGGSIAYVIDAAEYEQAA